MLLVHSLGAGIGHIADKLTGASFIFEIGFKSSLLLTDLFCLLLLDRLFPNKTRRLIIYYWLSPIVIVAVYWVGQNDIIPLTLFVYGLFWTKRHRFNLAGLCFGLAVGAKFSMAVGLPFFAIYLWRNKKYRKYFIPAIATLAGVVVIVQAVPLLSPGFRLMVMSTPEISRVFDFSFSVGHGVKIYLAPLLYLLVVYFAWRLSRFSFDLFLAIIGVSFFLILLVTPAPIGWYVWLLPFLVFHQLSTERFQGFLVHVFSVLVVLYHLLHGTYPHFTKGPSFPALQLSTSPLEAYLPIPALFLDRSLWITGIVSIGLIVILQMLRVNIQRNDYFRISRKPILIGVCGDSGTGKDILSNSLVDVFGRSSVLQISGDDYHSWDRHAPMWQAVTHLNPRGNDLYKLSRDVISILAGNSVAQQSYDHLSGRFAAPRRLEGNDVVVVSGLHALFDPDLIKRYDVTIYLDPPEDLKRYWKIRRDMTSRGWDTESIVTAMERRSADVIRFIEPQRARADLVFKMVPVNQEELKYALDNNDYTKNIRCKLEVTMKSGLYWENLVRDLVGVCGLHVDTRFPTSQPGLVEIQVEGDVFSEDIALSARNLPSAMFDLIDISPHWQSDMLGVMQLIVITQIELALRNRL
jgi:uridine kinase